MVGGKGGDGGEGGGDVGQCQEPPTDVDDLTRAEDGVVVHRRHVLVRLTN